MFIFRSFAVHLPSSCHQFPIVCRSNLPRNKFICHSTGSARTSFATSKKTSFSDQLFGPSRTPGARPGLSIPLLESRQNPKPNRTPHPAAPSTTFLFFEKRRSMPARNTISQRPQCAQQVCKPKDHPTHPPHPQPKLLSC